MIEREKFAPAVIWEAYRASGNPLCITGSRNGQDSDGLCVELYFSKKGRLKGVVVHDSLDGEDRSVVGKVPKDRV